MKMNKNRPVGRVATNTVTLEPGAGWSGFGGSSLDELEVQPALRRVGWVWHEEVFLTQGIVSGKVVQIRRRSQNGVEARLIIMSGLYIEGEANGVAASSG